MKFQRKSAINFLIILVISILGITNLSAQSASMVLLQESALNGILTFREYSISDELPNMNDINITEHILLKKYSNSWINQAMLPGPAELQLSRKQKPTRYFEDEIVMGVPVNTRDLISNNNFEINTRLHYKACHSKKCLLPGTVDVSLVIYIK